MKLDNSKRGSFDLEVFGVGPKDSEIISEFNVDFGDFFVTLFFLKKFRVYSTRSLL